MGNETTRIIFYGTPYFGARVLESLFSIGFSIGAVITQPDRRSGRGNVPTPSEVKLVADKYNLLLFQPTSKDELAGIVRDVNPDIGLVAAYGNIIPEEILNIPKGGTINIHGSLLPRYRGPSPIATAILNGDAETGITIIKMTGKVDAGPIISQAKVSISPDETTETLYQKLAQVGGDEASQVTSLYLSGQIMTHEQDDNKATYCALITKVDGKINWNLPAAQIERMIRAFIPWPNAYTFYQDKMLKILAAKVGDKALDPGYVVSLGKSFLIGTGRGSLEILKLQVEGKNSMTAEEFLNGNRQIDGMTLL